MTEWRFRSNPICCALCLPCQLIRKGLQQHKGSAHGEVPCISLCKLMVSVSVIRTRGKMPFFCCAECLTAGVQASPPSSAVPPPWTQMTHSHTTAAESMTQWLIVGKTYQTTERQRMMQPQVISWRCSLFSQKEETAFSRNSWCFRVPQKLLFSSQLVDSEKT